MDILGQALLIVDALWFSISPKKLCLMLQFKDDPIKVGFKLECLMLVDKMPSIGVGGATN